MHTVIKIITDFVPLVAFFGAYKLFGMITATAVLLGCSIAAVVIHYLYHQTVPKMLIITTAIIVVMGSLTIFSGNTMFVKMKPTVVSLIFAAILFLGVFRNKGYMQYVFAPAIEMLDANWIILSRRFGLLFLSIAILNEIVWRNMSEEFWVNFKVFGILAITLVFLFTQLVFIYKHQTNRK